LSVSLPTLLSGPSGLWADQPESARPKTLTVGLDNAYPPYVFPAPSGGYQGILVDLWKLWEHKTGVPGPLIPLDWDTAQDFIRQGKADLIDMFFSAAIPSGNGCTSFRNPMPPWTLGLPCTRTGRASSDLTSLHGFTWVWKKATPTSST
jgi:hypothetical protein